MEKKFGKLMALVLALVLVFPLLARPALANQSAALAEEPSVVKVYLYDSNVVFVNAYVWIILIRVSCKCQSRIQRD